MTKKDIFLAVAIVAVSMVASSRQALGVVDSSLYTNSSIATVKIQKITLGSGNLDADDDPATACENDRTTAQDAEDAVLLGDSLPGETVFLWIESRIVNLGSVGLASNRSEYRKFYLCYNHHFKYCPTT